MPEEYKGHMTPAGNDLPVNAAAYDYAKELIETGKVNAGDWTYTPKEDDEDGDEKEWAEYARHHLALDANAKPQTAGHYKYPMGADGQCYRRALAACRTHASQQGATAVYKAAGELLAMMDEKCSTKTPRQIFTTAHKAARFTVTDEEKPKLTGYCMVWGAVSDDRGGYRVRLMPGSARPTTPALALLDHDFSKVLATTANNTLTLTADDYGMKCEIVLAAQAACNREYEPYHTERAELKKIELQAEARYEKAMVTLSGAAMAFTVTFVDKWVGVEHVAYIWILGLSWFGFGACLITALVSHKYTYSTHKRWREILDEQFDTEKWKPGAMGRAMREYDKIQGIKWVDHLKKICFWTLIMGILCLSIFLALNLTRRSDHAGATTATPTTSQTDPAVPRTGSTNPTTTLPATAPSANTASAKVSP